MNGLSIRLLIVEDQEDDAELVVDEFEQAGYTVHSERVATEGTLKKALKEPWDLVISDHAMPSFSSRAALQIVRKVKSDIPFLLVSGSIGEIEAVEMMRLGVNDYILKDNLDRLVVSAEREMREAENRKQKLLVQQKLEESEREFRTIFEMATVGVLQSCLKTKKILQVNNKMCLLTGYSREELLTKKVFDLCFPEDRPKEAEAIGRMQNHEIMSYTLEKRLVRKNGDIWWGLETTSLLRAFDDRCDRALAAIIDISDLKKLGEEQAAAIQARDRFLSIASHELKTPLTSLRPVL